MSVVKVVYKGKAYEFDETEVKNGDDAVTALKAYIPALADGEHEDTQVVDGVTHFYVSSRAKPKGADEAALTRIRKRMESLPPYVNPAVRMAREIHALEDVDLLLMVERIEEAAETGERELRLARAIGQGLEKIDAVAARQIPAGF